jgi:hypothetical protein
MKRLQVTHDSKNHCWCGVGALSAIFGIGTIEATKKLKALTLRKYIKAVSYIEMAHAFAAFDGKRPIRVIYDRWAHKCQTLSGWLRSNKELVDHQPVAVCITGHWIVVHHGKWVDSMSHSERRLTDCPYLRARVRCTVTSGRAQTSSGS